MIDLSTCERHPGSYRDPIGTIYSVEGRIIRGLTLSGFKQYSDVRSSGLLSALEHSKKIVASYPVTTTGGLSRFHGFIEHEPIPFISYPYEWPFLLLKEAALLHLDIQMEALEKNFVLSDASAYNVQFVGVSPVFIDILSFRKYQQGELWQGHRQFCEQFLNPLLLFAVKGFPYQALYRGAMEGISTDILASVLPKFYWLSLKALVHVLLPARYNRVKHHPCHEIRKVNQKPLPRHAYHMLLKQLYGWIKKLSPPKKLSSLWEKYDREKTYTEEEYHAKKNFVAEFSSKIRPNLLLDLGCNHGEFSELALKYGTSQVIGLDLDTGALNKAVIRAQQNKLNFLPLHQDMANSSPAQGWLLKERASLLARGKPNALIALAFIHHLALNHNIPIAEIVNWLLDLAPAGVIEFVQKSDPTVQTMLAFKGDIFPDYNQDLFERLINQRASIIKAETISATNRRLYWYEVDS